AATIVAAWIRADTGVGPSIASGSHTCSGNCALLPIAAAKRPSEEHVIACVESEPEVAAAKTLSNSSEPTARYRIISAATMPRSPMRVVRQALLAAWQGSGFSLQNPISL